MVQYRVTGMSCAACVARVEKGVKQVTGVTACSASLLTNSLQVEGEVAPASIIAAVKAEGYDASVTEPEEWQPTLENPEIPRIRQRLGISAALLVFILYMSLGYQLWGWPLPSFLEQRPVHNTLVKLVLTLAVLVVNRKFFINGFRGFARGAANMDTLVSLGAGAAFAWSVGIFVLMLRLSVAHHTEDLPAIADLNRELYFESAAMILTLITVGKLLEARAKGRTTDALRRLVSLAPQTATLLREGSEVTVPFLEVKKGDIFVLHPGDRVPVDGRILRGTSAIDESTLTGESLPIDKQVGDSVCASTHNLSGYLECEAVRVGADTTLAQIIHLVSEAAASKAPIARIADKISGIFVPSAIIIAIITTLCWLGAGREWAFAIGRGISVLVISCPCALGLATPVAIMVGSGLGAKHGLLFKTAASLELMGQVQMVALDKTGTITANCPTVRSVLTASGVSEEELLQSAAALESHSKHPLGIAINAYARERSISVEGSEYKEHVGCGVSALFQGQELRGGTADFIATKVPISATWREQAHRGAQRGETPVWFSRGEQLLGLITVADPLKPDSVAALEELQALGVRTVMVTGDHALTADYIASLTKIDAVRARLRPEGKEAAMRALQKWGQVAMVGDGINDAPALTRADLGIAIGAGTDIALDAADIVLTKSSLRDVAAAIRLSRGVIRNIKQNLFWAFFYNILGIPLACGLFIPIFGWELSPTYSAAAMSLSSFCVVTNALRLNKLHIYEATEDRALAAPVPLESLCQLPSTAELQSVVESESPTHELRTSDAPRDSEPACANSAIDNNSAPNASVERAWGVAEAGQTVTLAIEGMMCTHCEATVRETLENFADITVLNVDHTAGVAVIRPQSALNLAGVQEALAEEDYQLTAIKV